MNWRTATLHDIERLFRALEQAKPEDVQVVERIINRVQSDPTLRHGRITIESLLFLLEQTNGSTSLPDTIVQQLCQPEPAKADHATAFAGWSFSELLAAGDFRSVDNGFTEAHFPLIDDGTSNLPVEEYCFGREISGNAVLTELAKLGFKPIGIRRAMEYLATHIDFSDHHILIIIGAQWVNDYNNVKAPYFIQYGLRREIRFTNVDDIKYHDRVHFLVVRLPR